jgi:Abortive infection alpha
VTDPLSSWGQAEKEKWKAIQKAIPLTERIGKFIGTIIGPAASELGGLLGDQMKAWRAANLERIERKWADKINQRGVSSEVIRQIPFRESILLIDAASQEDDDDVQELWARLIANATRVDVQNDIKKMHIDLLKSLNGLEACVLIAIFSWNDDGNFTDKATRKKWKAAMRRWPALKSEELRVCMQNLQRLGLVAPNITEMEILKRNTFDEWTRTVTQENIVSEFTRVVSSLIMELTNFSGNPMNDVALSDDPGLQLEFVRSFVLTRIGFDLWQATSERSEVTPTPTKTTRPRKKSVA